MIRNLFAFLALSAIASAPAFAGAFSGGSINYTAADDSSGELFAEAINDYPGTANDLGLCVAEVQTWVSRMGGAGYPNYRYYTDSTAWSLDFEAAGYDNSYGDMSDFDYISSHGYSGGAWFNGSAGDQYLNASETRFGDKDMDIIHFASCNTLDTAGRSAFRSANLNNGVHWIFGFHSQMIDTTAVGDKDGYYLANGYYVDTAWWLATTESHPTANDSAGTPYTSAALEFTSSACNTWYDTKVVAACNPTSGSWTSEWTWTL